MDFHLPQLGEGVYEAEMIRWLVAAGDAVRHGQGLMEVMTDKATMEVPAPFAGTVTDLRVQPGGTVKVGDLILSYSPAGAVPEEIAPPPPLAIHRPDGHGPGGAVRQDQVADLDGAAGLDPQLGDGAGERGGDLHGGLVGHDLHEALARLDGVAGGNEPADHLGFVDALAELGELKVHARSLR